MYNNKIVQHGEIEKKTSMHVSRMSQQKIFMFGIDDFRCFITKKIVKEVITCQHS